MEETIDSNYTNDLTPPERPDFLKVICILSFVACGLMILFCALGSLSLSLDPEKILKVWDSAVERSPQLAEVDAVQFMHNFGMLCVYALIANVFSLIGVIMMWRLEKLGFFIYAIAELVTNFFSLDMGIAKEDSGYGGLIFWILVDLIFIAMYFANYKYMNKKNNNTFIQSGS